MPDVLMSFALNVERLVRRGVPIPAIVAKLQSTEADVWDAIRMLNVPLPGTVKRAPLPSREVREAIAEKLPHKWQKHYGPQE